MPLVCVGLAACQTEGGGNQAAKAEINNQTKFASADYGVDASPRVTTEKTVRPGGGRYQLGDAYKIAGRWYMPKKNKSYDKVGLASWYGPNFHGRLTANGEIYNEYGLTAAHPTLPLPSYARVTNEVNGDSVIVRINDRGPFASNRIIDLSAEAAGLLHMKRAGVAKVRVQFVGMAPLEGDDNSFLMASYHPGDGEPATDTGASGTLLAMNEAPAPDASAGTASLPGVTTASAGEPAQGVPTRVAAAAVPVAATAAALVEQPKLSPAQQSIQQAMSLPDVGPVPADRPTDPATIVLPASRPAGVASAYAESRVAEASDAFRQVLGNRELSRDAIVAAWNKDAAARY
ncbi:MAG: septal ring lytic transglycosylase RlpA family protein [Pararhizobium sp.]